MNTCRLARRLLKPIRLAETRFRLGRYGMSDKVHDINHAGARVAREAAKSFDAWVAGSVGPLGIRIEPLGKTSFEEARAAFREQIAALIEGGVDLLMFETFGYIEELHQAILAARDVDPKIPIVAQVTVDEERNCLDGSDPGDFRSSSGRVGRGRHRLQLQRRSGRHAGGRGANPCRTSLPLAAQPNAGIPRSVDGRNIYLCSPEYMASYARKFVAAGVRLGGRLLRNHSRPYPRNENRLCASAKPAPKADPGSRERRGRAESAPAVPLEKRSRLGAKIAAGEFVTMVEIVPPKGTDILKELDGGSF